MFMFIILIAIFIVVYKKADPFEPVQRFVKAFLAFFICGAVVILIGKVSSSAISSNKETTVADGFTIEGYEVVLDVGLDNKVQVTENIDIYFYESGHHGIYKFIPYWLEYTSKDGKTIKRKANIRHLTSSERYSIDTVKKKQRIKIGNPYSTVNGHHNYVINYTYDMGKDPYNGFDEFIFHAFGDFWGTEIKNPKVVIHMPKDVSYYNINVFTDKYRAEYANGLVNKEVDGNTVTITGKNIHLMESLTVDIELPEGYFVGGSWNYGWISFTISILVIILTIYIIRSWYKYGKDYEKKVPTVEFYAPDDLSSAEVGYVYNKRHVSKKLTIALVIQLASKGYIKIDEIKDGKKSKIQITKLNIPPIKPKASENMPKHTIEIQKLKDADDLLSNGAAHFMSHRFKDGEVEQLSENVADLFSSYQDELVKGGYIEVVSDNDKAVKLAYEKTGYGKKITAYEKELEAYNEKLSKLPKKSALENIVYGYLFSTKDVVILSEHESFYKTFGDVEKELKNSFTNKVQDDKARKMKIRAFIIATTILFLSVLSFYTIEDMNPAWSVLYFIAFGCTLISFFFAFVMDRKTEYGEMISARIKGFRDFLITAEKEKLEALVEQNPHYFYDILPYTYVLNISKKWISKFENIKMPEVDMGNFNYDSDIAFHSIFDNVTYPSSSGSSSSGCSSCGGGCSSCGGGCSSCGGGGSW